jgi:hypothetical protein
MGLLRPSHYAAIAGKLRLSRVNQRFAEGGSDSQPR